MYVSSFFNLDISQWQICVVTGSSDMYHAYIGNKEVANFPSVVDERKCESPQFSNELVVVPRKSFGKVVLFVKDKIIAEIQSKHCFHLIGEVIWYYERKRIFFLQFNNGVLSEQVSHDCESFIKVCIANPYDPSEVIVKLSRKFMFIRYKGDGIFSVFDVPLFNYVKPMFFAPGAFINNQDVLFVDASDKIRSISVPDIRIHEGYRLITPCSGVLAVIEDAMDDFQIRMNVFSFSNNFANYDIEERIVSIPHILDQCEMTVFSTYDVW
ncbi:hypothetical protein PCE1_003555 [Barthelona sp. PCE]